MSNQTSYSNNPASYGSLSTARKLLRENPALRDKLLDCLVEIEHTLQSKSSSNIREDLSGPIVDMLFEQGELMKRSVNQGLHYNFRYSSKIARDFVLARGRTLDHVWEPQTTRSVVALSKGRRGVLIGGAYIGDHALYAARALAPGGRVHCFELSDESLALLRSNIAENAIANIVVNQLALWSVEGAKIVLEGSDSHASPQLAEGASDSKTFLSRTIDGYAADEKLDHLDLVMLDIEGGEYDAIRGAKNVLSRPVDEAPALICEIHRAYVDWTNGLRTTPLCAELIAHGYEVFCIRDYQGNEAVDPPQVELVDIDSAVVSGPPHGFNLLAVKTRKRLSPETFRIVHGVSPKLLKHRDPKIHAPLLAGHELP
jgi:FkbM family methyltransferase